MKNNKTLLLIGKSLIAISLLWPVPFGFIVNWFIDMVPCDSVMWRNPTIGTILSCLRNIPMWGDSHGYWWPFLGIIALGILLCAIACIKNKGNELAQSPDKPTPVLPLFVIIKWCLIGIVVFHLIATLLIGFVYVIGHIDTTGPYIMGFFVVLFLILSSAAFFNDNQQ